MSLFNKGIIKISWFVLNWQDWQDQHGCCSLVFTFPSLDGVGASVGTTYNVYNVHQDGRETQVAEVGN